jgi:hypothetical protein
MICWFNTHHTCVISTNEFSDSTSIGDLIVLVRKKLFYRSHSNTNIDDIHYLKFVSFRREISERQIWENIVHENKSQMVA